MRSLVTPGGGPIPRPQGASKPPPPLAFPVILPLGCAILIIARLSFAACPMRQRGDRTRSPALDGRRCDHQSSDCGPGSHSTCSLALSKPASACLVNRTCCPRDARVLIALLPPVGTGLRPNSHPSPVFARLCPQGARSLSLRAATAFVVSPTPIALVTAHAATSWLSPPRALSFTAASMQCRPDLLGLSASQLLPAVALLRSVRARLPVSPGHRTFLFADVDWR